MEKNNSTNKKTEDNKPVKKDASIDPIPFSPKNINFVPIIDQPLLAPFVLRILELLLLIYRRLSQDICSFII